MIIRVHKRESPYAIIDKQPLEDRGLSWKSKGLLSYLLSKPDNWRPIIEELAKASRDSFDSVKTGLRELERSGYLVRRRVKDDKGKIIGWEHIIYEKPQVDFPQVDFPLVDFPLVENPRLISNELINKDLINKEILKTYVCNSEIQQMEDGLASPDGARFSGEEGGDIPKKPSKKKTDGYSDDFKAFWDAYPRKKEQAKAWRVYKARLKEKVKPEDLLLAAKRYAQECIGKPENFIKLGATFLSKDKPYTDYLESKEECANDEPGEDYWTTSGWFANT